jgi:hypothetical protein
MRTNSTLSNKLYAIRSALSISLFDHPSAVGTDSDCITGLKEVDPVLYQQLAKED